MYKGQALDGGGDGLVGGAGKPVGLAVHLGADGLERAPRRMAAAAAGRRGNGVAHDGSKLGGRLDGPGGHDGVRDAATPATLSRECDAFSGAGRCWVRPVRSDV